MVDKLSLITNNKAVALLAPTFALDFKFPAIIGMLKVLGFDKVTELTYGASLVNHAYADYIKDHSEQKFFIASPCPTVVALIKAQYPELVQYLMPVVSPMAAMAKVYKKHHPDYKVVFISPCWAKENLEAPRFPEIVDAVITFKELEGIFSARGIKAEDFDQDYYFDFLIREYTKIYPLSGGLSASSHLNHLFPAEEILVADGVENIKQALEEIKSGRSPYRFLDLLNCPGGCIGGPAIGHKDLPLEQKREIIKDYIKISSALNMGPHRGKADDARGIDFSVKF